MKATQAIRTIARASNKTLSGISKGIGKTPQYINAIITSGSSPRVSTLLPIFDTCGYAICAIRKDRIPIDAIVIDEVDENEDMKKPDICGKAYLFSSFFDWESSDKVIPNGQELYRVDTSNGIGSFYFTASADMPIGELLKHSKGEFYKLTGKDCTSIIENIEKVAVDS